ncbi:unnamed protein product [Phyllotreta striolata]|uniref:Uncharacterized protein n=1 Tax=Phyllotreta striolata TaxID=444603 RepID=A0A9N9XL20_PHYSR|nr:unnamed protein product [Phyllotreta striolata]
MDENAKVPDSPKPLAFTIDFGSNQNTLRQKALAEKFQKRHKRGQSLSKLDEAQQSSTSSLPRKSSFQSEGYFSSDEKPDRAKSAHARINASAKRSDLSLPLRNTTLERMVQSYPFPTPEIELKDVSCPELVQISPFSPKEQLSSEDNSINSTKCEQLYIGEEETFIDGIEFDFDKDDTASDTGTYTLDGDNYSEEQKARMSIDRDFKIEQVTLEEKTKEYVKSLSTMRDNVLQNVSLMNDEMTRNMRMMNLKSSDMSPLNPKSPKSPSILKRFGKLSPILSPTQNLSITDVDCSEQEHLNNSNCDANTTFTKILYPSPNAKRDGLRQNYDQGSVISVTSSGAFKKSDKKDKLSSLMKSEVQVQAYIDNGEYVEPVYSNSKKIEKSTPKLTTTIVNVQSIDVQSSVDSAGVLSANIVVTPKLPPSIGGYSSSKIPSPTHTVARPRSRNNLDNPDTETILKPTQNYINSLQQRLSLDPNHDIRTQLNNTAQILKRKASHTRHNSLDDAMNLSNKLEHFQNKTFSNIDQTYSNLLNQYSHKIQNSPNNSPIRRSSSFTNKHPIKNTNNFARKESNVCNSPNVTRSSSSASIKPGYLSNRRRSQQFGDTESSSDDDLLKKDQKRKDLSTITNTRCNRAFSLRRARADGDNEPNQPLKCPNTPEMRRRNVPHERAISVDRKPMKTNEVQSRYLLNIAKKSPVVAAAATPAKEAKIVPKVTNTSRSNAAARPQNFARTDSGRYSMRASKPLITSSNSKTSKKDANGKKQQGGLRSNSSLSSREVEFQNWKRRKSYDPMKAAAEGKKKEQAKRQSLGNGQNIMTQSCTEANHSQDSSPSHSSSVYRSQSFHGTAALEQLISSDEEEEDLTLSPDECFSPPTPSPCEMSPSRASLRHNLWGIRH